MPGDPIIGFVTRGRGVTVHRTDCPNINSEMERLIEVSWGKVSTEQRYSVPIEIIAYDREGLMRDISTIISDEKVNMSTVNVGVRQNIATISVTMEITNLEHLTRILSRIGSLPSVVEARRRNNG
jgi:GTP pyrophosphokinase